MSKITPKNLHYDGSLPPFLARLQASSSSRDSRHEFHVARPKKARTAEEEAEDEPVYFDEGTGETLTKSEWEEREKADEQPGKGGEDGAGTSSGNNEELDREKKEKVEKERIAAIGGSKKRKAGKVVGAEDEDKKEDPVAESKHVANGKASKKRKKIKLSFGDNE